MDLLWLPLGTIAPTSLTESRLQLHYAVQFIAATGEALYPKQPDDSQASFFWDLSLNVFVGRVIENSSNFRVALEPSTLNLMLLNAKGETVASLPLHQKTLKEGFNWLKMEIANLGVNSEGIQLASYPEDFPDHSLAHGGTFDSSETASLKELAAYYANSAIILQKLAESIQGASQIRIWPHHFDMATLVTLPDFKNSEATYVGLGISPGDGNYPEPYWYVTPWPYSEDTSNLPELEGNGFWHTQGWVGAVLRASQLSPEAQQSQVKAFLDSGFQASRSLLIS